MPSRPVRPRKPAPLVLACRWRLARATLPLAGRHQRALSARRLADYPLLPAPLLAWVAQQLEWSLRATAAAHPDGVLLLTVDADDHAVLAVGPYAPLPSTTIAALAARAASAQREAADTAVAPETLWLVRDGRLTCADPASHAPSAVATLAQDLAQAWHLACDRARLPTAAALAADPPDEAFLASDEHGIVPAADLPGPFAARFADAYATLLTRTP